MAINTLEKLIDGLNNKFALFIDKASAANATIGQIHSRWRTAGFPTVGVLPTTAAYCNSLTVGAWNLPASFPQKRIYLAEIKITQTVLGQLVIYDRLAHMGSLSGTVTTPQTINLDIAGPASQGRCGTNGEDVLWGLEWYTDTGGTAVTATITYTNQSDVTGRTTTVSLAATMRATAVLPIMPNVDDISIKSIQSVTLSATTGTAGNFGVTARRMISDVSINAVSENIIGDYATLGMLELTGNECLELTNICNATSTGILQGSISLIRS